jgi:hypothetical protein
MLKLPQDQIIFLPEFAGFELVLEGVGHWGRGSGEWGDGNGAKGERGRGKGERDIGE